MKPAWDKLAKKHAKSEVVVVGDVDCTVHNSLCEEHGVEGFPTIKGFIGGEPEDYEGGRDMKDFEKYIKTTLSAKPCDTNNKGECSAEALAALEEAEKLTAEERAAKIEEIK